MVVLDQRFLESEKRIVPLRLRSLSILRPRGYRSVSWKGLESRFVPLTGCASLEAVAEQA